MDAEQLDKFDERPTKAAFYCFLMEKCGLLSGYTFRGNFCGEIRGHLISVEHLPGPSISLGSPLSQSHLILLCLLDNIIPILHLRQMRLGI